MLIDINANIGHWPYQQTNCNTCTTLLERMDKYGVQTSVVSNMNGIFYKDTHASNEEIMEEINSDKRFRTRLLPFGIINPVYGGWENDLDQCINKFGMKGIRLYPQYHDYQITDPSCIRLVKVARDKGIIVAFTIRMVDSRLRHWMDLRKEWALKDIIPVMKAVPDAKYMALNISTGTQLNNEDAKTIRESNMLMDTSGKNIKNLGDLSKIFGKDKFAFGTHSPILDYLTGLLRIESLRPDEADEQTKELFRSGNAKKILGLV